jgi:hypothetical protein
MMYGTLKRSFCSKSIIFLKKFGIFLIKQDFEFMCGQFFNRESFFLELGLFTLFLLFTTI